MFVEAVVFLSAIIGLLMAFSAFIFHLLTRKEEAVDEEEIAIEVDKAAETALEEIVKTSQSALDEMNQKYQELLFLYQLMEEKKQNLEAMPTVAKVDAEQPVSDAQPVSEIEPVSEAQPVDDSASPIEMFHQIEAAVESAKVDIIGDEKAEEADEVVEEVVLPHNPKYEKIKELQAEGFSISEIARHLNMGQGEVKLFIDLGGR